MMSKADEVVAWLSKYVGYTEGRNNDNTFAAMVGHPNHQPWCQTLQCAADKACGIPYVNTASTRTAWAEHVKHGRVIHESEARKGDLVYFDWPGGHTPTDHVERILSIDPWHGVMVTIGGNTSPDNNGSQRNGGGVYKRRRSTREHVRGYVRVIPEEDNDLTPDQANKLDAVYNMLRDLHARGTAHLEEKALVALDDIKERIDDLEDADADGTAARD